MFRHNYAKILCKYLVRYTHMRPCTTHACLYFFCLYTNCRGCLIPRTPMGIGGPSPFWFGRGRWMHKEQIEAKHMSETIDLPRFGTHGCVKPYSCFGGCIEFLLGSGECYSTLKRLARPSVRMAILPLSVALGPPFICLRGHRHVATEVRAKM